MRAQSLDEHAQHQQARLPIRFGLLFSWTSTLCMLGTLIGAGPNTEVSQVNKVSINRHYNKRRRSVARRNQFGLHFHRFINHVSNLDSTVWPSLSASLIMAVVNYLIPAIARMIRVTMVRCCCPVHTRCARFEPFSIRSLHSIGIAQDASTSSTNENRITSA